jgi:hypothetical protein
MDQIPSTSDALNSLMAPTSLSVKTQVLSAVQKALHNLPYQHLRLTYLELDLLIPKDQVKVNARVT